MDFQVQDNHSNGKKNHKHSLVGWYNEQWKKLKLNKQARSGPAVEEREEE